MEWSVVSTAITNMTGVCSTIVDTIADNPYLMVFLAAPVLTVGIRVVKKLIRVAR